MTDVTPEGLDEVGRCIDDAEKWLDESAPGHTKACAEITLARATLAAIRAMLAERESSPNAPDKPRPISGDGRVEMVTAAPAELVALLAENNARLLAENRRLQLAFGMCLVGGNHLATHVDLNGPTWEACWQDGLQYYGAGLLYDAWCCWKSIMTARQLSSAALAEPPG